jgi:hypothetical protein
MKKLLSVIAIAALATAACGGDDDSSSGTSTSTSGDAAAYAPHIDPANFTDTVDNPFFPLKPGTRWVYEGESEGEAERDVVEVTSDTREIMGVTTVVVHDTVSTNGDVTEDTFDWYAQDRDGNVWYFGEDSKELEDGKVVSTEGSWEGGVDGAQPGIVMKAEPKVGDVYRQEYDKGNAEDMGEVLSLTEKAKVPFGSFEDVLMTKDYSPLEPQLVEHKYYAKDVGVVLELAVKGGPERSELVEMTRG